MIRLEECTKIGKLGKPYGNQGAFSFNLYEDFDMLGEQLDSILVFYEGYLVPFFIDEINENGPKHGNIKFDHIHKPEDTREFVNCDFYISSSNYDSYSVSSDESSMIDFIVKDKKAGLIGNVIEYVESKLNPLLVCVHNDNEYLIPFNDSIVLKIDYNNKIIETDLPDGLLEINE